MNGRIKMTTKAGWLLFYMEANVDINSKAPISCLQLGTDSTEDTRTFTEI